VGDGAHVTALAGGCGDGVDIVLCAGRVDAIASAIMPAPERGTPETGRGRRSAGGGSGDRGRSGRRSRFCFARRSGSFILFGPRSNESSFSSSSCAFAGSVADSLAAAAAERARATAGDPGVISGTDTVPARAKKVFDEKPEEAVAAAAPAAAAVAGRTRGGPPPVGLPP
jgi:hypothetical protein